MDSYYQRNPRHHIEHRRHHFYWWVLVVAAILVYAGYCLFRPLPALAVIENQPSLTNHKTEASLPWPGGTDSAIGTLGDGVLATSSPDQKPLPTASVAKLITALTILNKFPLSVNQQGPIITLTNADVQIFDKYYAEGGSLVKVTAGEQISEHQALEAMLLPSANNMADSLAIWAFGSLAEYRQAAENEVNSLGLKHTTVGIDASGFDPSTTSTPSDLIQLGQAVMANPLLAQIISEQTATIPVAGLVHNVNYTLGGDGMIGIKTGNSTQAGGNFLFAANYKVGDQVVTVLGAIMHAPTVVDAMHDSISLLDAAKPNFKVEPVVTSGQSIVNFSAPWLAGPVPAKAQYSLSLPAWQGQQPPQKVTTKTLSSPSVFQPTETVAAGTKVGEVTVGRGPNSQTTALIASRPIPSPSLTWRLTHPF